MVKNIAFDKKGAPFGIGSMVHADNGSINSIGPVEEVRYIGSDGCTVRLRGMQRFVNTKHVELVRMSLVESEIWDILTNAGVKLTARQFDVIVRKIKEALERDRALEDAIPSIPSEDGQTQEELIG